MPEIPEVLVWEKLLKRKFKGLYFYLLISPLAFALGSDERSYTSLTVNRKNFTGSSSSSASGSAATAPLPAWIALQRGNKWPPPSWKARGAKQDWRYLLNTTLPGPLICVRQGKLLIVACGHHAMRISFGLEAHLLTMTPELFFQIIKNDISGPNPDKRKAKLMRTFLIPKRFNIAGSSDPDSQRTIRILAAFVSEHQLIVLCDFSGLARMHVQSRDRPWTEEDFQVGSKTSESMFALGKNGKDWINQRKEAIERLCLWRDSVDLEDTKYNKLLEIYEEGQEKRLQANTILNHFPRTDQSVAARKEPLPPIYPEPPSKPPIRHIVQEICSNSKGAFSGFGRHTANDLLFRIAFHPGTPAVIICRDKTMFQELKDGICTYMDELQNDHAFIDLMINTCGPNRDNPFKFEEVANRYYMQKYIDIFRRCSVQVEKSLYEKYLTRGLLNPNHTIGRPCLTIDAFLKKPHAMRERLLHPDRVEHSFKLDVYFIKRPLRAYTIIRAKVPKEWKLSADTDMSLNPVTKDIASFGYTTTIGLAQFRENVLNRVLNPYVDRKGGKPGKIPNPLGGRSTKKKPTHLWWKNSRAPRRTRTRNNNPLGESTFADASLDSDEEDDDGAEMIDVDDNAGDVDEDGDHDYLNLPFFSGFEDWELPLVEKFMEFEPTRFYRKELARERQKWQEMEQLQLGTRSTFATVLSQTAGGLLKIQRKIIRSELGMVNAREVRAALHTKEDVLREASRIVDEGYTQQNMKLLPTDTDISFLQEQGILDYRTALALLKKGKNVTDDDIQYFLASYIPPPRPPRKKKKKTSLL